MKRSVSFYLRALKIAGRNFIDDDCVTLCSSISFVFLLSIIPFSALFLLLLNLFKNTFLPDLFPHNMIDILVGDITSVIPFVSKEWVQKHLIDSVGLKSFTTINLLMLPIISGLLFKSLDQAFRRIFELKPRGKLAGQAAYAIMSIFAILIFFMANFIWTIVSDATASLQVFIEQSETMHEFYIVAIHYFTLPPNNLLSWLILVLFFLVTVKIFLKVHIKQHHRLIAAALFGFFWLVAREIFGLYIHHISQINVLFGSLSSVCIILLWIFYSSLALLFTVEYMYVLHWGPYKVWAPNGRRKTIK
jgi:membrane protein